MMFDRVRSVVKLVDENSTAVVKQNVATTMVESYIDSRVLRDDTLFLYFETNPTTDLEPSSQSRRVHVKFADATCTVRVRRVGIYIWKK